MSLLTRRKAVLASGLALVIPSARSAPALPGLSRAPRAIDVVKVMSFSCQFCRASEVYDRALQEAVAAIEGKFVSAPILSLDEDSGDRERVYYQSRESSAQFALRVKSSLYKGMQDRGLPLLDFGQVREWLLQDLPSDESLIRKAVSAAQSEAGATPLRRAISLADAGGITRVPTYILLSKGSILATLDTATSRAGTIPALKDEILAKISQLSTGT